VSSGAIDVKARLHLEKAHMDPLATAGLVVVLALAIAAGYYLMRPEKK